MINCDTRLENIQQNILQLTKVDQDADSELPSTLALLKDCLESFEAERALRRRQTSLVKSLYFPELRRRWDGVVDADEMTNTWLFDRSKTSFLNWLESGSGIYWITGKACRSSLLRESPARKRM
jgi:hypothetical protein